MSDLSTEPTTDTTQPSTDPIAGVTQPPPPPAMDPQTFKCEKCGATFTDEGAAAAHIQDCKGPESISDDTAKSKVN